MNTTTRIWSQHPIVKTAARRAEQSGTDTLGFLETMLDLMVELEGRFPGVPFAQVLQDPVERGDARSIRAALRRAGACEADIALVCPESRSREVMARKAALSSDPYHELSERL